MAAARPLIPAHAMPASFHAVLLLLHLLGVIVWVGGMFFAHVALRPAAAELLAPPQRLPLLHGALGRFFRAVALSVVAILGSGFALLAPVGLARAPALWHAMLGLGLLMSAVFAFIYARLYPRLGRLVQAAAWPEAGAVMGRIRALVALNLVLGTVTIAAAVLARG